MMRTSPTGIALIKEFEGFPNHGCPYRDPIGIWTRGYGRIEGIHAGSACISEPEASRELSDLLSTSYEPAVRRAAPKLNQNQFDAVVSVVYNLGVGLLDGSHTFGRLLRAGDLRGAADSILLYDKAGGRTLPGLTRRRKAERELFLKPVSKESQLRDELARIRAKARVYGWKPGGYLHRRADSIKRWLRAHR